MKNLGRFPVENRKFVRANLFRQKRDQYGFFDYGPNGDFFVLLAHKTNCGEVDYFFVSIDLSEKDMKFLRYGSHKENREYMSKKYSKWGKYKVLFMESKRELFKPRCTEDFCNGCKKSNGYLPFYCEFCGKEICFDCMIKHFQIKHWNENF